MLVIGLTGGIGAGKSTVSMLFQQLDVPVIDTDQLARDVVKSGSLTLSRIVEYFGPLALDPLGNLNRAYLRQQIFIDPQRRIWLEQLLHPLIRAELAQKISLLQAPYCIVNIPLLFETRPNFLIQHILVVDIPECLQLNYTETRDNISTIEVGRIMQQQVNRQQRLAGADDVIYNDRHLDKLKWQVKRLHNKYLNMA